MPHRCGWLLCRSGILHGFRYSVVPVLEKNPRELTVQTIERLASERRRINPWRSTRMITLLETCQALLSLFMGRPFRRSLNHLKYILSRTTLVKYDETLTGILLIYVQNKIVIVFTNNLPI